MLARRALVASLTSALLLRPRDAAQAWCGAPYPPYAYQLPWFEFQVAGADMRVVGDSRTEQSKNLSPLLVLPPPGLSYEYLEPLEALTISERRVAFVNWRGSRDDMAKQAAAALDALEAPSVHVLGHGTGAVAALMLGAREPRRVKSLILASPLATLDDAVPSAREALGQSLLPLLDVAATTKVWLIAADCG